MPRNRRRYKRLCGRSFHDPALNAAGIQTKGDIHFVGTVQEEGTGALKGMKYYVDHHPELEASISVDGPGYQEITYEPQASRRMR